MSAVFKFDVEPSLDLVRITMSGFFTLRDIDAFLAARAKAHAHLDCGPNQHVTLNDLRGMKIQSRESVDAFQQMLADPAYRSRRLAFVVALSLAQSQLFRALGDRDACCFEDPVAAEAWLLSTELRRAHG
ncbi:MAG: hypothetical protein ACXWUX_06025 [Allosphingosinicella sp.]